MSFNDQKQIDDDKLINPRLVKLLRNRKYFPVDPKIYCLVNVYKFIKLIEARQMSQALLLIATYRAQFRVIKFV